jgi:hypothetical protein
MFMKIAGIDPKTLSPEYTLVLPRGESFIAFKARGIVDFDDFNKFVPEPVPPKKMTREGVVADINNPNYQKDMEAFARRRLAYMVVKSLEPSEIEWDKVDPKDPGTWTNWEEDFKAAQFNQVEIGRITGLVLEANCLDEAKLKQAREVFLRGPQLELLGSNGPSTEQASTPSGEPVSA